MGKGKDKRSSGRSSDAPDDDLALWERLTDTLRPLNRAARGRAVPVRPALPRPAPKTRQETGQETKPEKPTARKAVQAASQPAPLTASPALSPATALDRREARALKKGRLAVEARLDLHGLHQRDAHGALRGFLRSAQGRGFRHVLVITGKGAVRSETRNFYTEAPRGVLRQQVPHWLSQADLADVVLSFSEAPRRLGGAGALYVRLKRAK